MSVHSVYFAQYRAIVAGRYFRFCLIAVGRPSNPFFFSCTHHVQAIVRIFLGKLPCREKPVKTRACGVRLVSFNCCELNCFK